MIHPAIQSLAVLCLMSCAHKQPSPGNSTAAAAELVFSGKLTYPETRISLPDNLTLVHLARRYSDEDPRAGQAVAQKTSLYELRDAESSKLAEGTSHLSDPKFGGEFEDYFRQHDTLSVMRSPSGNTLYIVEDRSPTHPHEEHRLFQKSGSGWSFTKLTPVTWRSAPGHPLDSSYAHVCALTDTEVHFEGGGRQWSAPIEQLKAHDF